MCTEECGQLEPPDERELLEAFQIVARDAFAFLSPDYDLNPQGMHAFNLIDGARVPVNESGVAFPFFVELSFAGGGNEVVVRYGDRHYELGLELALGDSGLQPLRNWMAAIGETEEDAEENLWVSSRAGLARHARRLAGVLREALPKLIAATAEMSGRIPAIGGLSPAEKERRRSQAREAFRNSAFEVVVDLLGPLEGDLTATELKQLTFARTKLGG